jgi:hypothetical protein
MEDIIKKGMTQLQKQMSEKAEESSSEMSSLVAITPVSRSIFPMEMKECVVKALTAMEDNEDTFLKCLYVANFLNYPALLQGYMENLAQDWLFIERRIDWKRRIKTWMWWLLGLATSAGLSFLIRLIPI